MQLQSVSKPWKRVSYMSQCIAIVAVLLNGCSSIRPVHDYGRLYPSEQESSSNTRRHFLETNLPEGWVPVSWNALPGWDQDSVEEAWRAFIQQCNQARRLPTALDSICNEGQDLALHPVIIRRFIEHHFLPYQYGPNLNTGLMTGYYEPVFKGALHKDARFRYPLYGVPDDLIRLKPFAKTPGSRGRRDASGHVVPYWTREEIDAGKAHQSLTGKELVYLSNPVDVFIAQVQGSVRVQLEDGRLVRLGYADGNGHPYKSVGRYMIDNNLLPSGRASMEAIREWMEKNPAKSAGVMAVNSSYVFFKEIAIEQGVGPLGSLGVPLTPMRSIAVDPHFVPLGSLVYMASVAPNNQPLQRLVLAQDVGSAIRGAQRADFFWGLGEVAGEEAGHSRHPLSMWLLWPRS